MCFCFWSGKVEDADEGEVDVDFREAVGFEGAPFGWLEGFAIVVEEVLDVGLLMPRASEAGGPTGMIREPNSTPIVTS